jgi:hypothetical protein
VAGLQVRAQALASLGRQREAFATLQAAVARARGTGDPAMFVRASAILLPMNGTDALLAEARATADRIAAALPDETMRCRFRDAEVVHSLRHC